MLLKSLLSSILLCFLSGMVQAVAPPVRDWQHALGGSNSDNGTKVISDRVGGYWILGNTDSNDGDIISNSGSTDLFLIHLDVNGSILRKFNFGGSGIDIGTGLLLQNNGNLILAGYSTSSGIFSGGNYGSYDGFILCVDTSGTRLWSNHYGGPNADLIYHILAVSDGFILTGGSYSSFQNSTNHGDQDVWVLKTDTSGNVVWQKNFGGSNLDIGYSSVVSGNDIVTAGITLSNDQDVSGNHGSVDAWILRLSSFDGTLIWERCYGGSSNDAAFCLKTISNGRLLFGGYSRSSNGDLTGNYGYADAWIGLIDNNGVLINQKNFGGTASDVVYAMDEASDGLVFTLSTTSTDIDILNNNGTEDVAIIKTDLSLNKIWSKSFGGTMNDRPASVLTASGGQITICGYTYSGNGDVTGNHGSSDIWVIHLSCLTPSMAIIGNTTFSCIGDTVTLVNRSTNYSSLQWYLNNNQISAIDTVRLTIQNVGNYTVSISGQTCYNRDSVAYAFTMTNCNPPAAEFASNTNSICEGGSIQFTDQSYLPLQWDWQFPGGNPTLSSDENPVVLYTIPGVYNVVLTVTNAAGSETLSRPSFVTVHANPGAPIVTTSGNNIFCNTTDSIQWYFNGALLQNSFDPELNAVPDGYYQALVSDEFGCMVYTDSVLINTSAIALVSAKNSITVFPNPVVELLTIVSESNSSIQLYDANSKVLFSSKNSGRQTQINMQKFSSGTYYLLCSNGSTYYYKKIVKE